jgi:hypothetical protein
MSLSPVDAVCAVTGTHKLKGWAKVAPAAQGQLDAILGGETNLLSQAARDFLRPKFGGLGAKTEEQQAQELTGVVADKAAIPYLTDEGNATAPTTYSLAGPTAQADYDFRGKKAAAELYTATFSDGPVITIVAPKAPEAGYHTHTVAEMLKAASCLPKPGRSVINTIMLNAVVNPDDAYWAAQYSTPDFHSYMTAGAAGVITVYPDKVGTQLPGANYQKSAMVHETGHTWSYKTWGEDTTKGKWLEWKAAMDKDVVALSGYATNSIAEDIAETMSIYVGTRGTPKGAEYRKIAPARFAMLDAEYK